VLLDILEIFQEVLPFLLQLLHLPLHQGELPVQVVPELLLISVVLLLEFTQLFLILVLHLIHPLLEQVNLCPQVFDDLLELKQLTIFVI
jgi:hypothetical protein